MRRMVSMSRRSFISSSLEAVTVVEGPSSRPARRAGSHRGRGRAQPRRRRDTRWRSNSLRSVNSCSPEEDMARAATPRAEREAWRRERAASIGARSARRTYIRMVSHPLPMADEGGRAAEGGPAQGDADARRKRERAGKEEESSDSDEGPDLPAPQPETGADKKKRRSAFPPRARAQQRPIRPHMRPERRSRVHSRGIRGRLPGQPAQRRNV